MKSWAQPSWNLGLGTLPSLLEGPRQKLSFSEVGPGLSTTVLDRPVRAIFLRFSFIPNPLVDSTMGLTSVYWFVGFFFLPRQVSL